MFEVYIRKEMGLVNWKDGEVLSKGRQRTVFSIDRCSTLNPMEVPEGDNPPDGKFAVSDAIDLELGKDGPNKPAISDLTISTYLRGGHEIFDQVEPGIAVTIMETEQFRPALFNDSYKWPGSDIATKEQLEQWKAGELDMFRMKLYFAVLNDETGEFLTEKELQELR